MLFGIVHSLITFENYINLALYKYLDLFYITYWNDILIYSKNTKNHTYNIRKVLKHLLKYELFVKLKKYILKILKIGFFDFILTTKGIKNFFYKYWLL